jgi:hypothetical protein
MHVQFLVKPPPHQGLLLHQVGVAGLADFAKLDNAPRSLSLLILCTVLFPWMYWLYTSVELGSGEGFELLVHEKINTSDCCGVLQGFTGVNLNIHFTGEPPPPDNIRLARSRLHVRLL